MARVENETRVLATIRRLWKEENFLWFGHTSNEEVPLRAVGRLGHATTLLSTDKCFRENVEFYDDVPATLLESALSIGVHLCAVLFNFAKLAFARVFKVTAEGLESFDLILRKNRLGFLVGMSLALAPLPKSGRQVAELLDFSLATQKVSSQQVLSFASQILQWVFGKNRVDMIPDLLITMEH